MSSQIQINRNLLRDFNFQRMALTIIKGNRMHFIILLHGIQQAGCTVLPATEYHNGFAFRLTHSLRLYKFSDLLYYPDGCQPADDYLPDEPFYVAHRHADADGHFPSP